MKRQSLVTWTLIDPRMSIESTCLGELFWKEGHEEELSKGIVLFVLFMVQCTTNGSRKRGKK